MEYYHRVGRSLQPRDRSLYFRLGAEIQNRMTVRLGFKADANYTHDLALQILEATNWKSLKAARAMMINVSRL